MDRGLDMLKSLFGAHGRGDDIDRALANADVAERMGPWSKRPPRAIGGLTALGFDRVSENMLVTSHAGQSVIDGRTGDILYRNRDADGLEISSLKGTRLDHPAEERFDMAGLYGGGLRRISDDGWSVENLRGHCVLFAPHASARAMGAASPASGKGAAFHLLGRNGEDVRALGFSWSGRTLVLATPDDLTIWSRPATLLL